jgi:uncharacterized RDD family membrane protein YckC
MTDRGPETRAPGTTVPAGLFDRVVARVIDFVLLAVVVAVVVDLLVVRAVLGHDAGLYAAGASWVDAAVSAVLTAAIQLGYFALMESQEGRTVGKSVLRLRTLGPGGERPTLEEAVRRNVWTAFGILGVLPVVGGLLGGLATLAAVIAIAVGINADPVARQGWHDRFAGGTRVVKQTP